MRLIKPTVVTEENLLGLSIPIDSDSEFYGDEYKGEWDSEYSGGYAEADVVYKGTDLYESLISGNEDDPEVSSLSEEPTWLKLGKVNRWKLFDNYVNAPAIGPAPSGEDNESVIEIDFGQDLIDTVTLLSLDADYIEAFLIDPDTDEIIWSETYDLWTAVEDPADWYEYFFGDDSMAPQKELIVNMDRVTSFETTRVKIVNIGSRVQCGQCIIGRGRYLGMTKWRPEIGILDFSRKLTDDFGRTYLKQGDYAKIIRATLDVPEHLFDSTNWALIYSRGQAYVWDFNEDTTTFDALVVFGFFENFKQILRRYNDYECRLRIIGLT